MEPADVLKMGRTNYSVAVAAALAMGCLMVSTVLTPVAVAQEPPDDETTTTTVPPEDTTTQTDEGEGSPPDEVRTPPNPVKRYNVNKDLVFPIVGSTYFYAGFGACRDDCSREHHGIDIMSYNWKGLPVVAAHDGTVTKVTFDEGNPGCSVRIKGADRWETRYYHLNNDAPGTDEIGFSCPVEGIDVGTRVKAGQLIAYVGDSGNAETTPPHIHFELRMPSGHPVDPYRSLRNAKRVSYEWLPTDFSVSTIVLAEGFDPNPASVTMVVTTDEAEQLMSSEFQPMFLDAPLIAVDPSDPAPALAEIDRLGSRAIVIMADADVRWLENLLVGRATIVETVPLPRFDVRSVPTLPEALEQWANGEPNVVDIFATVIAGRIDKIWRSRVEAFEDFSADHRSLVLVSDSYAKRYLGHRSTASPGRYADRDLLWWATGNGWIGTETLEEVPDRGFAYVTERMATPWTLAFLSSLTETTQVPRWKTK